MMFEGGCSRFRMQDLLGVKVRITLRFIIFLKLPLLLFKKILIITNKKNECKLI